MIEFNCANCGKALEAPDADSGKKTSCRHCNNFMNIPGTLDLTFREGPGEDQSADISEKRKTPEPSIIDDSLETPFEEVAKRRQYAESEQIPDEYLHKPEPLSERKYPFVIDIFAYPANRACLTTLGVIILVPALLHGLIKLLSVMTLISPIIYAAIYFILLIIAQMISGFVVLLFCMYFYWYFGKCIIDSAEGQIRAPETIAITPTLGELLMSFYRIIVCLSISIAPAGLYYSYSHSQESVLDTAMAFFLSIPELFISDKIFALLIICSVVLAPVSLLIVHMFNSVLALNPIRLIRAVFVAPLSYLGLMFSICVMLFVSYIIGFLLLIIPFLAVHVTIAAGLYFLVIIAHLIGRFYFKNQDKLNWDI